MDTYSFPRIQQNVNARLGIHTEATYFREAVRAYGPRLIGLEYKGTRYEKD